jgi:hypothetical protein
MRPFERRESGTDTYPRFKLATWDARNQTWKDGKSVQMTEESCRLTARKPGRYRMSRIDETGYSDLDFFTIS